VNNVDPRLLLARRLRALREERRITQHQLAQALVRGRTLSVPLISSWESKVAPGIPPVPRLEAYAALFGVARSFAGPAPRLLGPDELTAQERQSVAELTQELLRFRSLAQGRNPIPGPEQLSAPREMTRLDLLAESLTTGPWRFRPGETITLVVAPLPDDMLAKMPYTDINDPDYIELLAFSDLDSLLSLVGHLRAANPVSEVNVRLANRLQEDDYATHIVSIGGVDWNLATTSLLQELELPVRQVADWDSPDGQFFEVAYGDEVARHRPVLDIVGSKKILRQDVALFARAVNPFNKEATVTIVNAMYGRGNLGAVRALTDPRFRGRNAEYLAAAFPDSRSYCILSRVSIINGRTMTPDWTNPHTRLFEWSGERE
jgi:transcriptional regulator with XRE-family HTH domain